MSHCSNASIFSLKILKVIFDHGSNDLVFVRIFYLEILKGLFGHGINDLVFVICVPLDLSYLGLDLGYLLGMIILCLKKIPCLPEKLCCFDLLFCNSSIQIMLVTCLPLRSQWCCIQRIDDIHLGKGVLLILPRIFPPKLLLILGRYPLICFGWKGVSLPISYPVQRCKSLRSTSPITWA